MSLPARRLLNVVMRWAVNQIEPEKREEWVRMINEPINPPKTPTGKVKPTPEELQADADAFMSLMASQGKM